MSAILQKPILKPINLRDNIASVAVTHGIDCFEV